jgi:hypothetical protein
MICHHHQQDQKAFHALYEFAFYEFTKEVPLAIQEGWR